MSYDPSCPGAIVRPWPSSLAHPRCTLTVAAPGVVVIGVLAGELRRRRLRVRTDPDGRFVYAKPAWFLAVNVAGALSGGGMLSTPTLRARATAERAGECDVAVWAQNVGWASGAGRRFPDALNAMAARFAAAGVAFTASAWERTPSSWNWRETLEDIL